MTNSAKRTLLQNVEEYFAFMAIKDQAEALDFLKERLSVSVGKSYYTPSDYRWETLPLKARLSETHRKRWTMLRVIFRLKQLQRENGKFHNLRSLVNDALYENRDHLRDWVGNRYAVPEDSYYFPDQFATTKEENEVWWELKDTLKSVETGLQIGKPLEILYYWKKVSPANEDPTDGRRHCILMDRKTQEEAPLMPGVNPYNTE